MCVPLYIFWFLHQTATYHTYYISMLSCISFDSYIKPQPWTYRYREGICCISFDSYIKPQQCVGTVCCLDVVYLLIPTSNHNSSLTNAGALSVVYLLIPTSNHNLHLILHVVTLLYIFWFLHQTTTFVTDVASLNGCISFDSYIKPQLMWHIPWCRRVVYLLIPTSNHNYGNFQEEKDALYIFWFLHQTTTKWYYTIEIFRCISFDSYIKPQLPRGTSTRVRGCISFDSYIKPQQIGTPATANRVVYLLIPTSNHNHRHHYNIKNSVVYLLIPTSNHNRALN